MADIASGDVTYTLVKQRKEESGNKVINLTVAFGNATLTYPSGGIPLVAGKLGCPNNIADLIIDGPASGDGLVYKYDKANNKIRIYRSGAYSPTFTGSALSTHTHSIPAGTDAGGGTSGATSGGTPAGTISALAAAALSEVSAGAYAPAATTLYIRVSGY